ncbi:MAG TPA: universal stress protein [Ktedonobacterales bacterium]
MSDQQRDPGQDSGQTEATPPMSSASLSEMEAARIREDARRQEASQPQQGEAISGARGRVEEETRRLSERMTREAQERRKAEQALAAQQPQQTALAPTAPLAPPHSLARLLPDPQPIRSTLVALDGSVFAERAIPYAAALARLTGCALTLGSCAHPESGASGVIEAIEAMDGDQTGEARALRLSTLAARDRLRAGGLTAQARVIGETDVAAGLLALSADAGADTLALATHARAGMERIVLGSVADEVVRRGSALTLVVPPLAPDSGADDVTFARVLAPLDGSTLSEATLGVIQPLLQRDPAGDEARALRTLTLFFVAEDHSQVRDAEVYLHDLREALLRVATAPTEIVSHVVIGSAPGAIVARAAGKHPEATTDGRYDLIIMATHGRGGLGRWFFGSVATYALAHSEVPVLLARAEE